MDQDAWMQLLKLAWDGGLERAHEVSVAEPFVGLRTPTFGFWNCKKRNCELNNGRLQPWACSRTVQAQAAP